MKLSQDDQILWQLFKGSHKDAFKEIYFAHFNSLYEYGQRIARDKEFVEDAIHDLFIKLWNNKDTLGDVQSIKPYLLVSLRSILLNKLTKNKHVSYFSWIDQEDLPFEMVFSVESAYLKQEKEIIQKQELLKALNSLTGRQKEVIWLRYFEDVEYEKIAEIMGISLKATYKLKARGIENLKEILKPLNSNTLIILLSIIAAKDNF